MTPREWLAIPADADTVELVATVLDAGAAARRRASLAIAEELVAERRDAKRDIRSGAVKLAEVLAEASVLEKVAAQVRRGDPPPAEWDPAVLATLATGAEPAPASHAVELDDGRTAWVPDPEAVAAALGTDAGEEVPDLDADEVPLDLGAG